MCKLHWICLNPKFWIPLHNLPLFASVFTYRYAWDLLAVSLVSGPVFMRATLHYTVSVSCPLPHCPSLLFHNPISGHLQVLLFVFCFIPLFFTFFQRRTKWRSGRPNRSLNEDSHGRWKQKYFTFIHHSPSSLSGENVLGSHNHQYASTSQKANRKL